MSKLACFKAYDIRGKLDTEITPQFAYRLGRAYGQWLKAETEAELSLTVVVGGDARLTSENLKLELSKGLLDAGIHVLDIGQVGTEEIYFTTFHLHLAGGIEVTASHNPIDYNGMKLVKADSQPLSTQDLLVIHDLVKNNDFPPTVRGATYSRYNHLSEYVNHIITYINPKTIRPLTIVANAGNGVAGHVIDALENVFAKLVLPIKFIKIHHEVDGTFPNGIPNPLLPECRADTTNAVLAHQADFGIAWDGDFDRCFLFDEKGNFIEGYYIVGLLAQAFLTKYPKTKIIHDPRLTWNTIDIVNQAQGQSILSKTGHAFIKARMRKEDAIYGGEMSAHHYFKDFSYCDSGMIPWLLVAELISVAQKPLSALVKERMQLYPCSGEINFQVVNTQHTLSKIQHYFETNTSENILSMDHTDGLSIEFRCWRFNLRGSNTEPVLRLNVESRRDKNLMHQKTNFLSQLIISY